MRIVDLLNRSGRRWSAVTAGVAALLTLQPLRCSAQGTIEVRECYVVDSPDETGRFPQNNDDGIATPGEWVGLKFIVELKQGLPDDPWVRVTYDESLMGFGGASDTRRARPTRVEGSTIYSVDLSDSQSRRLVRRQGERSTVLLELMDGLRTLGGTTYDLPILGEDVTPPVVLNIRRHPEGIVRTGDRVTFTVTLVEASRVANVHARVLQLPRGTEAASITLMLSATTAGAIESDSHGGEWMFEGGWTVDREGEFVLEVSALDDHGNEQSAVAYLGAHECRFTTEEFSKEHVILVYDRAPWSGKLHSAAEILSGLHIPFDHWHVGLRGENMDIWLDYAGDGQLVIATPPFVSEYAYPSSAMGTILAQFGLSGGNLLVPGAFDIRRLKPEISDLLQSSIDGTLLTEDHTARALTMEGSASDTFKGMSVQVSPRPMSVIRPLDGRVMPLLVDADAGTQAILVEGSPRLIYLNFDLAAVAGLSTREELLLRSMERLLGKKLPRDDQTAVLRRETESRTDMFLECYPNPFNPSVSFRFGSGAARASSLTIYNLVGQEVRRFSEDALIGNTNDVRWDGRDNEGREIGPGVYLSVLEVAGHVLTQKVTALK